MAMRDAYKNFRKGTYLYNFFAEKDVPDRLFDVQDSHGVLHTIPNEVVVEHIALTSGGERKKIEDTLRKIDFANGDVNHFLRFLAKAIAERYEGVLRASNIAVAHELQGIASLLVTAGQRTAHDVVKFQPGDLVKFEGRSRNIFEVMGFSVEYALEGPNPRTGKTEYLFSLPHVALGKIFQFDGRPSGKYGHGEVGDNIVMKRDSNYGKAGQSYRIRYVHVKYNLKGVNNKKQMTIGGENLVKADAPMLDKKGRDAVQAAQDEFGGVGGLVVIDMYRLMRERVGKILKVTPKGGLIVQQFGRTLAPRNELDRETFKPNFQDKLDKVAFTADLFRGEWVWGSSRKNLHVKGPYKGGTVTSLLD